MKQTKETIMTIATKIANAIEVNSDINFEDGYKPENAPFKDLSLIWNKENGVVVIEFENAQQFEITVKEKSSS